MRFAAVFLLLAACAGASPPPPPPDTCGSAAHLPLIGQDARALERVLILRMVRIIHPDDAVTLDFQPDRINFFITPDGMIGNIRCG